MPSELPGAREETDAAILRLRITETHHRVKNHLQILASMMSMQARRSEAPLADVLIDAQRRIIALSRMHDLIRMAGGEERIEIASFMTTLCADLAVALGPGRDLRFD